MRSSCLCLPNAGITGWIRCSYPIFSLSISLWCPLYWLTCVFLETSKLHDVTNLHIQGVIEMLLIRPTPQFAMHITLCGQRGASPAWVRVWLCGRKHSSVDLSYCSHTMSHLLSPPTFPYSQHQQASDQVILVYPESMVRTRPQSVQHYVISSSHS